MDSSGKRNDSRRSQEPMRGATVEPRRDDDGTVRPSRSDSAMDGDGVSLPYEDWRELARRIQEENDPQRMILLVQQLVDKFDEEELRKRARSERNPAAD